MPWNDDERSISDNLHAGPVQPAHVDVGRLLAELWRDDVEEAVVAARAIHSVETEFDSGGEDAGDPLEEEEGMRVHDMLRRAELRRYGASHTYARPLAMSHAYRASLAPPPPPPPTTPQSPAAPI